MHRISYHLLDLPCANNGNRCPICTSVGAAHPGNQRLLAIRYGERRASTYRRRKLDLREVDGICTEPKFRCHIDESKRLYYIVRNCIRKQREFDALLLINIRGSHKSSPVYARNPHTVIQVKACSTDRPQHRQNTVKMAAVGRGKRV